jgi:hypothetical protein
MALPLIIISFNLILKILFGFNKKNLMSLNLENIFDIKNSDLNLTENLGLCMHNNNDSHNDNHLHNDKSSCKNLNEKLETKDEKIKKDLLRLREIFIFYSFFNFVLNFILVVFFAHIQIINRVITSNPLLYFFYADKIIDFTKNKSKRTGKFVIFIFFLIGILGCVMYPGGYGFA